MKAAAVDVAFSIKITTSSCQAHQLHHVDGGIDYACGVVNLMLRSRVDAYSNLLATSTCVHAHKYILNIVTFTFLYRVSISICCRFDVLIIANVFLLGCPSALHGAPSQALIYSNAGSQWLHSF